MECTRNFGGSYIDAKENLVFINTIDLSKEHFIRSIPANYSTYQFDSSFKSLNELADKTNSVNIMFGISPIYNKANVDFTLIEKASNKIDLIPAIRSSYGDFPSSLLIENFSNQTNAGQHIYIFSNEIHITYGLSLIACLLIGNILHHGILKIELFDVFINNMDIGGTVLSYLPSTEHQRVEVYVWLFTLMNEYVEQFTEAFQSE
ncbi:hypothetical protein C2G38_2178648 [Gigaspora rosea]|uniref:Uncharacterized protein n=1 Tax=Gigaspora rosea TaxID=44941 RepID=A0A397VFD4_9GLOM|nr:hypothetical protein C2G38_2178648 [Gigaspora rosea]